MRTILLVALLALICPDGSSMAQVPQGERTPITDPDVLESMGFPRDATRVYRAKRIGAGPPPEAPEDWGGDSHFTSVTPYEFTGIWSVVTEPYEWGINENGLASLGSDGVVEAPIELPTGVRIEAVRWWAHDVNASEDLRMVVIEFCHPAFEAGPPEIDVLADGGTSGSTGHQTGVLQGGGFTVNNRDCYYTVRLRFFAFEGLEFGKLRIQWSREVSPPPAVATFNDVPTNHPFFQFIEALAASGITAGCGNGNFCPNNPVTRGQMAVFLSIALGLYFP